MRWRLWWLSSLFPLRCRYHRTEVGEEAEQAGCWAERDALLGVVGGPLACLPLSFSFSFLFLFSFFVREKRERRKVILRGFETPKIVNPISLHLATEMPRCTNFSFSKF